MREALDSMPVGTQTRIKKGVGPCGSVADPSTQTIHWYVSILMLGAF